MKYTCDIIVTGSSEAHPKVAAQYEYFVRAQNADACLELILADLKKHDPARTRILSIGLEENDSPHVPFPDGVGIVVRRGPTDMVMEEQTTLMDRIRKWIGANKPSDATR